MPVVKKRKETKMDLFRKKFIEIFGEGLAPYGYVRLKKSKHVYFGKLINDEMLAVVTYRKYSNCGKIRSYEILSAVTSVYGEDLTMDEDSVPDIAWLNTNISMCGKDGGIYKDIYDDVIDQEYMGDDENIITEVLTKSLELTKKYSLPAYEKVENLNSFFDYCIKYNRWELVYSKAARRGEYLESALGYISFVIFGNDIEKYKKWIYEDEEKKVKELNRNIEIGNVAIGTKEQYEEIIADIHENVLKSVEIFENIASDNELYEKVCKLIEENKKINIEKLKKFGFKVKEEK